MKRFNLLEHNSNACLFVSNGFKRARRKKKQFDYFDQLYTYHVRSIYLGIYIRFMDNITISTSSTANKTLLDKQPNGLRTKLSTHALVSWDMLKCNFT